MKLAVLRHSMTGRRAAQMITGALTGSALAGGLIVVAGRDHPLASLPFDLLGVGFALWTAGWLLGPALFGGGDETLRPEHFSLLSFTPRRLAAGLAGAAFVGVAPLVTLVAFSALVVVAAKAGLGAAATAVGVLAAVLQLVMCVLASRLVTAVLGQVMRSKAGAALAALVSAVILAGLHSSWVLSPLAQAALRTGFPDPFSTWIAALPSGWGLVAVRAAGHGQWPTVAAALTGLAALGVVCWYGWAALLKRRLTTRRASGRPARVASGAWAKGPMTAVAARELRTWSRDLLRFHYLVFALCYALAFCLLPLAIDAPIFLPWTGAVFALWVAAISANLYGEDGTELWGKMMIPDAARHDVRGRQLAWLLVTAPPTLVLTAAMVVFTGEFDLWPWLAALVPALLGGGAGVTVLVSVLRPVPLADPHRRGGNLLENGTDFAQVLLVLILTAATAAPAYFAVRLGPVWAGPVTGLVGGAAMAWLLGRLAATRLESSAPELLLHLRTGVSPKRRRPAPALDRGRPHLPKPDLGLEKLGLDLAPTGRRAYVIASLTLCWVPLVAQGIVPALMLTTGQITRSWFLALHLPQHLQWPTVIAMIALGLVLLTTGLGIGLYYLAKSRRDGIEPDGGP
ncbi:transporter [Streptosporangium pseudovulgare]|uniref:Transporter n=2 Tax=Streptosporangium pseudovulgare TaxID=35765 RepID=A0ABQ2QP28_9ACTN|nr:transporter [Streptosporangium pseudovulgare]